MGLYLATKCLDHLMKAGKRLQMMGEYPQTKILMYFWPTLLQKDSWTRDDRWGSRVTQWFTLWDNALKHWGFPRCQGSVSNIQRPADSLLEGTQPYCCSLWVCKCLQRKDSAFCDCKLFAGVYCLVNSGNNRISPLSSPVRGRCVLTFSFW